MEMAHTHISVSGEAQAKDLALPAKHERSAGENSKALKPMRLGKDCDYDEAS